MTTDGAPAQWRIDFDAEIVFANGGALQTQGFRLDIPRDDISDEELGELFVRHLGLLMVGGTRIIRREPLREPHKGSRNSEAEPAGRRTTDLTGPSTRAEWGGRPHTDPAGPDLTGLVDLPLALLRLLGAAAPIADRLALAAHTVTGRAVVIHTGRPDGPFLTADAADLLIARGAALVATDATGLGDTVAGRLPAAGVPLITGLARLGELPAAATRVHAVPFPADGGTRVRIYGVTGEGH